MFRILWWHFSLILLFFINIESSILAIVNNLNPLSANFTKWSNKLKQFVGNLSTNCLSVFDHFVGLAFKGLKIYWVFLLLFMYEITLNWKCFRGMNVSVFFLSIYFEKRAIVFFFINFKKYLLTSINKYCEILSFTVQV